MDAYRQASDFLNAGRPDLAEPLIRRGLDAAPDGALGHALLGLCHAVRGRLAEGEAEANEAVRLAPGDAFAHYVLGCILHDQGRLPAAAVEAETILRQDPLRSAHVQLLARVRFSERRYEACRSLLQPALGRDPENPWLRSLFIDACRRLGYQSTAEEHTRELARLHPHWAPTHIHLGWAAYQKGLEDQARLSFQEALRIDPMNAGGLIGLKTTNRRVWALVGTLAAGAVVVASCVLGCFRSGASFRQAAETAGAVLAIQCLCAMFIRPLPWRFRLTGLGVLAAGLALIGLLIGVTERRGDLAGARTYLGMLGIASIILGVAPFAKAGRP